MASEGDGLHRGIGAKSWKRARSVAGWDDRSRGGFEEEQRKVRRHLFIVWHVGWGVLSARHRYQLDYVEQMVHDATAVMNHAKEQAEELNVLCTVSISGIDVIIRHVDLRDVFQDLTKAHKRRKDSWHKMRAGFAETVTKNFHKHCARRNFTGEIQFAHHEGKLKMKVGRTRAILEFPYQALTLLNRCPQVQTEEVVNRDGGKASMNKHNSKDPRALSGGETSFATICLLLSIWECVACPLRCLDEFDVFMDAHNRKLAMSLLVSCSGQVRDIWRLTSLSPKRWRLPNISSTDSIFW
jgi:hypothetical protein